MSRRAGDSIGENCSNKGAVTLRGNIYVLKRVTAVGDCVFLVFIVK